MRVAVDHTRCLGTAFCVAVSEELFTTNADGQAEARSGEVDESLRSVAEEAVRSCPTQAISIEG